jgi:hypothetical protein
MTLRIFSAISLVLALGLASGCGDGSTPATPDAATSDGGGGMDGGGADGGGGDSGGGGVDSGAGDSGGGGGDSGGEGGDSGGTDTDAGGTDGDGGMCPAPPATLTPIGMVCPGGTCPPGYTCQAYSGIVLQHMCAIRCEPGGCPCPDTTTCQEVSDKTGTWHECRALDV